MLKRPRFLNSAAQKTPRKQKHQGKEEQGKTMTARDMTEFYALFSSRRSGNFLQLFAAMSLLNCTDYLEKKENIHWRKFKKSSGENSPKLQISVACCGLPELLWVVRRVPTPNPTSEPYLVCVCVCFFTLAHQNRTIAIASDFRVDRAKLPELPQKEGVSGSEIATRNRKSLAAFHRALKSQCNIKVSEIASDFRGPRCRAKPLPEDLGDEIISLFTPTPQREKLGGFLVANFLSHFPKKNGLKFVTPKTSENFTTFSTARKDIYHLELTLGATSRKRWASHEGQTVNWNTGIFEAESA